MTWVFWLYACIALPWFLCTVFYGVRSQWWSSPTGVSQFVTYLSLTAALGLAAFFRVVHLPHPLAIAIAVGVLGAIGVAGAAQLINVLRLQSRPPCGGPDDRP